MTLPSVSVVIPVKNEALKIRACIEGILSQSVAVKEIIVIDSGSTDGTIEILNDYDKVKVIPIASSEFNHGLTRNLGVNNTSGEFVLFTVGDARAYNNEWIKELLKGFTDDFVAGVCGQQVVPHEIDKNPVEWFRPTSEPEMKLYQFANKDFEMLSPVEKKNVCGWDDVTAMYRRRVIEQIPFQKTSYSEDAIWAKEAILKGFAIVYNPTARVFHYHLEDAEYVFKRTFTSMYFRYKQFGYLYPTPTLSIVKRIKLIRTLLKSVGFDIKQIWKWYRYNINNFEAMLKSYDLFMSSLVEGERVLDVKHSELCGKPPIPLKSPYNG